MYKMNFFDYLKIYFKRPSYIISDIKDLYYKRLKKNIEKKRLQVYEYDCRCLCYNVDNVFNEDENNYISFNYYNPIFITMREIEHLYTLREICGMQIKGITTERVKKDCFMINIELKYPGKLIGRGGEAIDNLMKRLSDIFGMNTMINIIEYKVK